MKKIKNFIIRRPYVSSILLPILLTFIIPILLVVPAILLPGSIFDTVGPLALMFIYIIFPLWIIVCIIIAKGKRLIITGFWSIVLIVVLGISFFLYLQYFPLKKGLLPELLDPMDIIVGVLVIISIVLLLFVLLGAVFLKKNELMKKRNPFTALILSFFAPGVGQIYNSQFRFGFILLVTFLLTFILFTTTTNLSVFIFFFLVFFVIWLFSIFHACIKAIKIQKAQLLKLNSLIFYLALIFSLYSFMVSIGLKIENNVWNIVGNGTSPSLLDGDFIFAKRNYYKKNSPEYGDLILFKDKNNKDKISRIVGLPGDEIQMVNGVLFINKKSVPRKKIEDFVVNIEGTKKRTRQYKENLFGLEYNTLDITNNGLADYTPLYKVPDYHFFVMGDNRDNSLDSRFLKEIGYIPRDKIFHKIDRVLFSLNNARFIEFWKWPKELRYDRFLKEIN